MTNKFQIKRTTVSGRTPNTTNSANTTYIDTGELAINLPDGKLYSSNGSVLFEVGANLSNLYVGGNVNIAGSLLLAGSPGTSSYVVTSNGSGSSWQPIPGTPIYDFTGVQIANLYATVANYINDLADVNTVTVAPANNNLLVWSNTSSNWVPSSNVDATTIRIGGKKAVNGPAFGAYANNTLQTITSGTQQKVLFQIEEFDTDSCYANSRFTPTVEGYYQLNASVRLDGNTGIGETMLVLWKNGGEHKRGWNSTGVAMTTAGGWFDMTVGALVYANGSTDYFEIAVQQTSGANNTVTAVNNPALTWFNGAMVRGA